MRRDVKVHKLSWWATGAALVVVCGSVAAQSSREAASAYERLDESRLAAALKDLQMTELLEALLQQSGKFEKLEAMYLQSQAKIAAAEGAKDEAQRTKLLEEAMAIQDELIKQTQTARSSKELLRHYRYTLDRVVTEGITDAYTHVERLQYFLARPDDGAQVEKCTRGALEVLTRLMGRMQMTRDDWAGDEEMLVTGDIWKLEELINEARYRGAWIRFYRGMVLPASSAERGPLLQQAIEAVADFANAEDNASGVKFASLLLSGMAARELGEWHNASSFLNRAADKDAGPLRLKAMFEMARALIEQRLFDQASSFIQADFATVGRQAVGEVAVEMQSSLLKSRLLEAQAQSLKPPDAQKSERLMGQSIQVLLDFIEKRPEYREAFMEVIAPKFEGRDAADQPPEIQVALGVWQYNKKTPEGMARAARLFETVRADPKAGDSAHATALWYLGVISNVERKNLQAGMYFRELAEKHPRDTRAEEAAWNALRSLNGILVERKTEPRDLGKEFVEQYAGVLKVLTDGWASTSREVRLKYYDLGTQYEVLGRTTEAIDAYLKVPSDSELYLPSRYRILDLRVQDLLDKPLPSEAKRQLATNLVTELRSYRARAREYIDQVKEADPERAKQVRSWAARCHLLEAQLCKDVLDDAPQAIRLAQQAARDWPEVPDIEAVSQQFVVRVLLETGQTDQAIGILEKLKGAEDLLVEMINQIRVRIDRLELQAEADSQAQLRKYRQAYRAFAERLYDSAQGRNLTPEQMYPFEQALAGALEQGSQEDATRALAMYEKLDAAKPNEAGNIRGLARCYARLGRSKQAMEQYDKLLSGLPEGSAAWWRVQIERLEFCLSAYGKDADALKDVLVHIRQLRRFKGSALGDYYKQFGVIEGRATDLLKAAAPNGEASTSRAASGPGA